MKNIEAATIMFEHERQIVYAILPAIFGDVFLFRPVLEASILDMENDA